MMCARSVMRSITVSPHHRGRGTRRARTEDRIGKPGALDVVILEARAPHHESRQTSDRDHDPSPDSRSVDDRHCSIDGAKSNPGNIIRLAGERGDNPAVMLCLDEAWFTLCITVPVRTGKMEICDSPLPRSSAPNSDMDG